MIQTLEQAEEFFHINDIKYDNIKERNKHTNPKIARIKTILNIISFKKVLIKYDLIENGEDVLIHWESKPEIPNTW